MALACVWSHDNLGVTWSRAYIPAAANIPAWCKPPPNTFLTLMALSIFVLNES